MSAITEILASLNEIFVPMDEKVLEETKVWAKERVAAIKEYRYSVDIAARRAMGEHAYYARLFAAAGGKTWFGIFDGRNEQMINKIVEKNCQMIAANRNASIAKKLEKAGVTSVQETTFTHTKDGFNGTFVVETNKGTKRVTIETIYAGGYNIQCLHLRVLTKIK